MPLGELTDNAISRIYVNLFSASTSQVDRLKAEAETASQSDYLMKKEAKIENAKLLNSVNKDLVKNQEINELILKLFTQDQALDEHNNDQTSVTIENIRSEYKTKISEIENNSDKVESEYKEKLKNIDEENADLKKMIQTLDLQQIRTTEHNRKLETENERIAKNNEKLVKEADEERKQNKEKTASNGLWINAVVALMSLLTAQSNFSVRS